MKATLIATLMLLTAMVGDAAAQYLGQRGMSGTGSNPKQSLCVAAHMRSDGAVVSGHMRTNSNNTQLDNFGTRGNTNPYTGAVDRAERFGKAGLPLKKWGPLAAAPFYPTVTHPVERSQRQVLAQPRHFRFRLWGHRRSSQASRGAPGQGAAPGRANDRDPRAGRRFARASGTPSPAMPQFRRPGCHRSRHRSPGAPRSP